MKFLEKPKMMEEASSHRAPKNLVLQILIFFAVFIIATIVQMIFVSIPSFIVGMAGAGTGTEVASNTITLISLFSTVVMTIMVIIYCKFIEGRSLYSIGMAKTGAIKHYGIGLLLGLAMFVLTYAIIYLFGGVKTFEFNSSVNIGILIAFFLGFVLQGMSEEFLCRGFVMNSIGAKNSIISAIIISSVLFAALHLINPGITVLSVVNLFLYGAFLAVYMIVTNNIWGASAIHSIWNFAQGNIFGVLVSGQKMGDSLFLTKLADGKDVISGGSFGAEGGLATTIVLVISIALVFVYDKKRKKST